MATGKMISVTVLYQMEREASTLGLAVRTTKATGSMARDKAQDRCIGRMEATTAAILWTTRSKDRVSSPSATNPSTMVLGLTTRSLDVAGSHGRTGWNSLVTSLPANTNTAS